MRTISLFLLLFITFISVASAQNYRAPQPKRAQPNAYLRQKKIRNGTCQLPASVTGLNLSHTEIASACLESTPSCSSSPRIEVATTAPDVEASMYIYKVSGGKIIGSGVNVIWDLSGVEPGEYSITAGIDMKPWGVLGQTQTRRVQIIDCPDCRSEPEVTDN